tara:strand:- start:309 stop:626 length:318 start_codon:yes stop_codon:yes gene_type:complete
MVDKKLYEEIEEYCALNGLDTVKTLNKVIRNGLTILKYGLSPKPHKAKKLLIGTSDDTQITELVNGSELTKNLEKENKTNSSHLIKNQKETIKLKNDGFDLYGEK